MRLTYDWHASTFAERAINFLLRPLGLDCFLERHELGSWQWGIDRADSEHTATHLWAGPFHIVTDKF